MATSAFLLSRQCPRLLAASARTFGSSALRGGFRQHESLSRSIVTLAGLSRYDHSPLSTFCVESKLVQGPEDKGLFRPWRKCKLHANTKSEEMVCE